MGFERLAVLGLGLLGGSVALAARRAGAAARVVGATRNASVAAAARRTGAVDEIGSPEESVRGADLVVLASPVHAMPALLRRAAPALEPGALVTDVGSVKGLLAETLPGLLPRGVHYVGAHPMAGSHESGFEHARADLFEGAPCVVIEPTEPAAAAAVDRVCDFWRRLGARVLRRAGAAHDAEVAWISHTPHALAFAYAAALGQAPAGARELVGSGFRDFTRIGRSSPALWGDILTANRKALAAPLQAVAGSLAALARAVDAGDAEAVERWIAAAREHLELAPSRERVENDVGPRGGPEGSTGDDA